MSIPSLETTTPSGAPDPGVAASVPSDASLPPAGAVTPSMDETLEKYRREAAIIAQYFPGSALAVIAGKSLSANVSAGGFQVYLASVLGACGSPQDPLEAMMMQQLVQAHFRITDLNAQSATETAPETTAIYTAAASRLMAEFRRSMLALKACRSDANPKPASEPTQGPAAAANRNDAAADAMVKTELAREKSRDTKLRTNSEPSNNERPTVDPSSDRRSAESLEAKRTKPRWSPEASRNGHGNPPLEILNGAQNGRG